MDGYDLSNVDLFICLFIRDYACCNLTRIANASARAIKNIPSLEFLGPQENPFGSKDVSVGPARRYASVIMIDEESRSGNDWSKYYRHQIINCVWLLLV